MLMASIGTSAVSLRARRERCDSESVIDGFDLGAINAQLDQALATQEVAITAALESSIGGLGNVLGPPQTSDFSSDG
jgi:hypothetical protein